MSFALWRYQVYYSMKNSWWYTCIHKKMIAFISGHKEGTPSWYFTDVLCCSSYSCWLLLVAMWPFSHVCWISFLNCEHSQIQVLTIRTAEKLVILALYCGDIPSHSATFELPYYWMSDKGGAHMYFINVSISAWISNTAMYIAGISLMEVLWYCASNMMMYSNFMME